MTQSTGPLSGNQSDFVRVALTGAAAGVAAAWAMELFQQLWSPAAVKNSTAEPATAKAADGVAIIVTGQPVRHERRRLAALAAHYGLGAVLGVAYFAGARHRPAITTGAGSAFGIAVALALDDTLVPALGWGSSPWSTPPSVLAYGMASHLVFGGVLEVARRGLDSAPRSSRPSNECVDVM